MIPNNQCIGCVTLKKFVKGKWFPLTLAAVIAAILALILFLFGFRITCSPEQDNNWDAVSACASWIGILISAAGVIASFVAIWFAIRVPKKIADRQDKIALFEKRLACFNELGRQRILFFLVKENDNVDELKDAVIAVYCHNSNEFNKKDLGILVDTVYNQCVQITFLFEGVKYEEASNLGIKFGNFVTDLFRAESKKIKQSKDTYLNTLDKFMDIHIEKISECLFLNN